MDEKMLTKTFMSGAVLASVLLASFFGASATAQDAVQWPVEDGGNGHWYAAIALQTDEATLLGYVESIGASPASISDAAEDTFVRAVAANETLGTALLGARETGNGNFAWLDGTPFEYTN